MIHFKVDNRTRTRVASFEGEVNDEDLLGAYERVLAEPDYDPTLDDLVDLRGVMRLDVSSDAVRRLVALFTPLDDLGIRNKLAIVAPTTYVFGMARMYEILRSDSPEQICVFRDMSEAERWLSGDDGACED
jgi:hypothetical protein